MPEPTTTQPPAGTQAENMFTIEQVLSITTGRLCCEIGGVYEVLNHLTGDNLYTHVLPRAARFATPLLLESHPELQKVDKDGLDKWLEDHEPVEAIRLWIGSLGLPAVMELSSYADRWLAMDPIAELAGIVGAEKVVLARAQGGAQ